MTDKFLKCLYFTLLWEGGYVNHPYDKGGCTNKGITQGTYDDYCKSHKKPNQPVRDISAYEIQDIYFNRYWIPMECEEMETPLACASFDFAVHSGVRRAKRYLMSRNGLLHPFIQARIAFLRRIAKGKQRVFLRGWMNRMDSLKKFVLTL